MYANHNAPPAVTYSAIIYALRCMVTSDIPLNQVWEMWQGLGVGQTMQRRSGSLVNPARTHTHQFSHRSATQTAAHLPCMHLPGPPSPSSCETLTRHTCRLRWPYVARPHPTILPQGCLAPITVRIPPGCILNPSDTAAVVGGNVLTSQRVTDVVLKAFQAAAASQVGGELGSGGDGSGRCLAPVAEGWDGRRGHVVLEAYQEAAAVAQVGAQGSE